MIIAALWLVYGVVMLNVRRNKKIRHLIPLLSALFLLVFGLLAVFNVSVGESFDLTRNLANPTNFFYFNGQITNIIVGLVAAFGVLLIPARLWGNKKMIIGVIVSCILLQMLVLLPSEGWAGDGIIYAMELNGARGWIRILGFQNLQPAEFFKIGYVFFLAFWLVRKKKDINSPYFFGRFLVINILLFLIFLYIKDLGTVMVLGLTGLCMCRFAGASTKWIGGILGGGLLSVVVGLSVLGLLLESNNFVQWQRGEYIPTEAELESKSWGPPKYLYLYSRLTYFISPDKEQEETVGWQQTQAVAAVGGGQFRGRGIGQGLQKFRQIPEAYSDFIFAAFAEEIGFVGNMLLLTMYGVFFFYCLWRLPAVHDPFLQYVVAGCISLLMVQTFVNIGVNIQILPNTGITLPFISYGGSSMIAVLMMTVILYKILR